MNIRPKDPLDGPLGPDLMVRLARALGDRYQVEGLVGEGGMALVYQAQDQKHHRPVAIKVLRPEVSAALGRERFLREIEVAAGLNHPNILALHDSGEAEGLLFFVMPYVEGPTLRARLEKEPRLPLDEALRITQEIGNALEYAHGQGLVHRDIKPENILFQAGHALVGDFGIAQATEEAGQRLTRTGMAVGTVTYMSPEQLGGEGAVDGRTDLYALGCLLHEMLAGEAPFDASTAHASLAKKLTGDLPDLTLSRPEIPPTVTAVLERALAIRAEERYDTPGAFTQALELATTTAAVEADALRRRRGKRNRSMAQALGVALLAAGTWWVSTLGGGSTMQRIAVLPLEHGGTDPTQEYFVQGVHQDLVLELSKAGMRVIAPSSVARFAASERSVSEIAEELGVDGVIQGQAILTAGFVGLRLTLVDGLTDEIIRTETFREATRNINTLYREATRAMADWIGLELSEEVEAHLGDVQEVDPQVYDAILQARFHWQRLTEEGLATAEQYYRLAIERDSTSAEAWFGVSQIWRGRAQMGMISGEEARRNAEPYVRRAEQLDPSLSSLNALLAVSLGWTDWDWEGSERAFLAALDADPTDSVLRAYLSHLLLLLDRDQEAMAQIEEAVQTDPFNTLVQGIYGMALNFLHRYEEAEEVLLPVLERDPEAPILLSTLRTTYHLMGRHEDALRMWRASYGALGDEEAVAALTRGYRAGGYNEALRAVADTFVVRAQSRYVTPWQIATLYTRAGEGGLALDYLDLALADREPNMPYLAVDPIFDFLRQEPRFRAMVTSLGLPH
jgi:TolB-like protein